MNDMNEFVPVGLYDGDGVKTRTPETLGRGAFTAETTTRTARAALRAMGALKITLAAASAAAVMGVAATSMSPAVQLTSTTALILGGTGVPTPNQDYLDAAVNTYLTPALGGTYDPVAVFTPEEGLGTLPGETMSLEQSTVAGLPYLDAAIAAHSNQPIVVFGYSQSGAMASLEKKNLTAYAEAHPEDAVPDVTFVWAACGCRPNGSLSYRTGGMDTTLFDGRARTDTPFETVDIAWQYDISSDTPLYPINLLADVNWLLGGLYVHTNYLPLPSNVVTYPNGGQQATLDGVPGVTAPGLDTTYYFIPSEHLPLFGPLRSLGVPEPLIDIVEPLARVIVEWGYDRTVAPWQPTPFRLIPSINPLTAATDVVNALGQGFVNALKGIGVTLPPQTTTVAPTLNTTTVPASTGTAPLRTALTSMNLDSTESADSQPHWASTVSDDVTVPKPAQVADTPSHGATSESIPIAAPNDADTPSTPTPTASVTTSPQLATTTVSDSTTTAVGAITTTSTAQSSQPGGTATSETAAKAPASTTAAAAKAPRHSPSAATSTSTDSRTTEPQRGKAPVAVPGSVTAPSTHLGSAEPDHADEPAASNSTPNGGGGAQTG